jgi:hypothetical protein
MLFTMLQIFRIFLLYDAMPPFSDIVRSFTWYCAFYLVWHRLIPEENIAFSPSKSSICFGLSGGDISQVNQCISGTHLA